MSWRWIWMAIPAVLVMRLAGFISDFWVGLGIIALLAFAAVIESFPTTAKNLIRAAFVGWIIVFLILPALWDSYLARKRFTDEALQRRSVMKDFENAEFADPVALKAKLGMRNYCFAIEDAQSEWLDRELRSLSDKLARSAKRGDGELPIPDRAREQKLMEALRTIEESRKECKTFLLSEGDSQGAWLPLANVRFDRESVFLYMIAGILLVAILIGGKAAMKKIAITAAVIAAIAAGGMFLFPTACSKTPKLIEKIDSEMGKGVDDLVEGRRRVSPGTHASATKPSARSDESIEADGNICGGESGTAQDETVQVKYGCWIGWKSVKGSKFADIYPENPVAFWVRERGIEVTYVGKTQSALVPVRSEYVSIRLAEPGDPVTFRIDRYGEKDPSSVQSGRKSGLFRQSPLWNLGVPQ